MENYNSKNIFLDCASCSSTGKQGRNACNECQGIGEGILWRNKFLYWGKNINSITINQDKIKRILDYFFNSFLFAFGLLGFLMQLYRAYSGDFVVIVNYDFWNEFSLINLIFWVSLLTDLYLYYRLEYAASLKIRIERIKYQGEISASGNIDWPQVRKLSKNQKADISKSFDEESTELIKKSWKLAKKYRHTRVMPMHLLASLLSSAKINYLFVRFEIDIRVFAQKLANALSRTEKESGNIYFSKELKQVLLSSYINSAEKKVEMVDSAQLFLECVEADSGLAEIFYDLGATKDQIENIIEWIRINEMLRKRWQKFQSRARLKPKGVMNRAMTAVATPILDSCSYDLTQMAKFGYLTPCIERDKEIGEIFRLVEAGQPGIILVGEPGIGKRTIIEGITQLMVEEDVPEILRDKRLVNLSIPHLVGGLAPQQAQEKLLMIVNEISRAGNVVLYIDNISEIMGISIGMEGSLDLSEVLSQALSGRSFLCFATCARISYSKHVENSTLGQTLKPVKIEEPKGNQAIRILESKVGVIEYKNSVYFSYNAVSKIVEYSDRYLHDQYLPEKAIGLLEEAGVYVKNTKGKKSLVLLDDIAKIISDKVKVPLTKITEEESDKLLNLEDDIHKRMINQEEAVKSVASALRRARAELRSKNRPIASFLFLGPTGVGKTELAKTVADLYFGSEELMIRLDMSEYQEKSSIERLIGNPGGDEGGFLTETIRKNPYSLILLDEIEKAHKDILNVFLQVFDDGRLTDVLGRTVDFTNTIIIATSNAGSQYIQDEILKQTPIEQIKNGLLNQELKTYFTPEFLNRFDGVIVFAPLTLDNVVKIANLMLKQLQKSLEEKGISFFASPDAIKELAQTGYDPKFGARPLRRVIQEKVDNIVAEYLLGHKLGRRDTIILEVGGKISIKKAEEL